MSAAADISSTTTPAGAIPSSVDNDNSTRLQQPNDAVAMENINEPSTAAAQSKADTVGTAADSNDLAVEASAAGPPTATDPVPVATAPPLDDAVVAGPSSVPPALKDRQDSVMAIGPAQDEIKAVSTPGAPADDGPVCNITLLLTSGSRHPYKISARYLERRNVPIPDQTAEGLPDPFSISIYTLKELILREWRNDWEAKPASPSSIRLIHFGKLLDDKEVLRKYQFSPDSPNVVHMSIRPQDLDEEEPKTGAKNPSAGGADGQRQREGGCCVVL